MGRQTGGHFRFDCKEKMTKHNRNQTEKQRFYEVAAKRFKAEVRLYGATAAIHIEDKNDEVFWGKVLI